MTHEADVSDKKLSPADDSRPKGGPSEKRKHELARIEKSLDDLRRTVDKDIRAQRRLLEGELARIEKSRRQLNAQLEALVNQSRGGADGGNQTLGKELKGRFTSVLREVEGVRSAVVQIDERLGSIERHFVERHLKRHRSRDDYPAFFAAAEPVLASGRTLLDDHRLYVLWQAVRNTLALDLPIADVGTYKGGSAYFLATASGALGADDREVHVFDTFVGHLPERFSEFDDDSHRAANFTDTSVEDVAAYLADLEHVHLHPGDVSEVAAEVPVELFSLAHIDVDLYRPTLDSLRHFGKRLPPGGVLVVDDFGAPKCPGVHKAVEDYLAGSDKFHAWDWETEQLVLVKRPRSSHRLRADAPRSRPRRSAGR